MRKLHQPLRDMHRRYSSLSTLSHIFHTDFNFKAAAHGGDQQPDMGQDRTCWHRASGEGSEPGPQQPGFVAARPAAKEHTAQVLPAIQGSPELQLRERHHDAAALLTQGLHGDEAHCGALWEVGTACTRGASTTQTRTMSACSTTTA
jgi:hypothetical protein